MIINYIERDRSDLARLFKERGYRQGAEIGVDRGLFSKVLIKDNPNLKLYCIDPWKLYKRYTDFTDSNLLEKNYRESVKRLSPYSCEIIRKSSEGAAKDFAPNSLDFVYIDGNHSYEYVLKDLRTWSKIVRVGGIVSGHDYTTKKHKNVGLDVKKAIDQFLKEEEIDELNLYTRPVKSTWFYERRK